MRRRLPHAMRAAALLCAALLGACAAAPPAADEGKRKSLESYAKDPFVPVNLYVNSDERLSPREMELTEYVARRLAESGAFLRVDRGTQRWAYTLQLRYHVQSDGGAGAIALRALCALTLGLVPVRIAQEHVLGAEIFLEPDPVGRLDYREAVGDRVSLYDLADANAGERAEAERLLERLAGDLARKKLLPAARSYKAPPAVQHPRRTGQSL